ncbi:ATPase domain-containing protein [Natronolimnohabitans innermongolicus]|uniref:non-specific serine/threonine protein kinase n=1 Tax=Natronolimnohabitans innermongolicus JCM 12255 TaxID=1227499 RepID=L9X0B2_9EURY|nr:ATPase domain-containing protein [Natronolimnohabitans innermongolicus]ELY54028.1 circadian clock protein KaiC [Natronolimnohabitans innermongolicus JCM 12255]
MDYRVTPISSGVDGLDALLNGGFAAGRMYLIQGQPGTGKTLLGMHVLEEGLANDETVLFIHGEESRDEILANGRAVGIDISDAEFLDLGPDSDFFVEDYSYDLVDPSDIERDRYTQDIHEAVRDIDPDRAVVDPITQLRYVEANDHQFRKRILSFMRFLKQREVTVVTTATSSPDQEYDTEIRSLSDGIIELDRGVGGRRIQVTKHRALGQMDEDHGMEIRTEGIEVYPQLIPDQSSHDIKRNQIYSGIPELDELIGGGFDQRTVTFISGPTGAGKTSTGTQFLQQAAENDLTSAIYLFEEDLKTYEYRSESIGMPVSELRDEGVLSVTEVEPLARSSEEFSHMVKTQVEEQDADVVMIDGIDGYTVSVQGNETELIRDLHALSRYLKSRGVTVLITNEINEITGISRATDSNLSYVADNIMFLSYVEMDGSLRKVVGVLKKRTGGFEHNLREFEITGDGIHVGESLTGLYGILQGSPRAGEYADIDLHRDV